MEGGWVEYDLGPVTIGVGCHPAWQPSRDGTTVAFEVDDFDATYDKLKKRGVAFDMEKLETPVAGWRSSAIRTETNFSFTREKQNESGKQENRKG